MRTALGFIVSTALLAACHADVAAQGSAGGYGGYPQQQPYYGPGQGYAPPPGQPGYAPPPGQPGYAPPGYPPPPAAPGEPATWGIPNGAGWTLREREQWKALSDSITGGGDIRAGGQSSQLFITQRECNTEFTGGFVFDTFRGRFIATQSYGVEDLDRYVSGPLHALERICAKGAMYSDAVRRKVQRIEVRWADGGRSSWVFGGGVLVGYVSPRREFGDSSSFTESIVSGLPNYL